MASYTIEDIELIRRKSGISYQEAVALLDYHNGNVARALVDLERNGRIKPEAEQKTTKTSAGHDKSRAMNVISRLYQARLKVKKDNITILNLSALFSILTLLVSPHLVLIGVIVMLVLGYKVTFTKRDEDFVATNLEKMVRNAAQNVKDSVSSFAQEFTGDSEPEAASTTAKSKSEPEKRSYYQANPAATTYHHAPQSGSAPTLQVPVQVESQDGKVSVDAERDGSASVTVE